VQSAPTLARLAWLLLALCLIGPAWSAETVEPMPITVGVPPVARFTRIVGGPFVRVQTLLPAGSLPDRHKPTRDQVTTLAGAGLYVGSGERFESAWIARLRTANPGLPVVDIQTGAATPTAGYAWTSPPLTKQIAWRIRDALSFLDPAHALDPLAVDSSEVVHRLARLMADSELR